MPQLILLVAAGAGLYAGYKWISKALAAKAEAMAEDARAQARKAACANAKDLGALEWDPATGVYRPARPRRGQ